MKKLEIKHLAPYLPYGLKVRYNGIINGKELGIWKREQQGLGIFDEPTRPMPETKYGDKIGLIKKVEIYLKHWYIRVGNGHKVISPLSFGDDAFLILRPLSDLTKEIEHDGERFVPLKKLGYYSKHSMGVKWILYVIERNDLEYRFQQKLFEWHFDVFGLIDAGLAIDKNTLNK